jgi:squalene-hopene/tetraprenyl-beta-curcumene cyclase
MRKFTVPGMNLRGTRIRTGTLALMAALLLSNLFAQNSTGNASLRNEIDRAISRGADWLAKNQTADGSWSTPDHPAVTALALIALRADGGDRNEAIKRGYDFLAKCIHEDGSVHNGKGLVNYNTSLALLAFATSQDRRFQKDIAAARAFLVRSQIDQGEKGISDTPFDGGVGYGSKYEHSDMGNTVQALEALALTRKMVPEGAPELNWQAAIHFLQNCQNLTSHNKQSWASDDPSNKGGFIYYPGHSMAGPTNLSNGRIALRSYGSISYAGLLSYIHAELSLADPRVTAVVDWLRKNYTLEENPGMGPQGLYYYFHTMAKALDAAGLDRISTPQGDIAWREKLALRLLDLQRRDGSWENENGRWWEKDPALVTSYGVITLKIITRAGL